MLADLLYQYWPYQIFKSVFFRGGLSFLSTYLIIVGAMPYMIRLFRRQGITSDFVAAPSGKGPYAGPKPIMGGGLLIVAIAISILLWVEWNQFILALLVILVAFGAVGAMDDVAKVRSRQRVDRGREERQTYTDKADGISGRIRLGAEVAIASVVVVGLYRYVDIDGHLVVPFIPLKWWFPYLPRYIFIPFMVLIIVAGANAVNLTDGMDSLATVPIITCTLFIAGADRQTYTDKADGISGRIRLGAEVAIASVVVVGLYRYVDIDGHLVVPFIPLKWWFPYLPRYIFIPFMVLIIVAGANAVNLTDGMDSLATVPIITCTLFIAGVAYVGADPDLAGRLKVPLLSPELRELVIVAAAVISAGLAFLQFNAPPAMITMGDMGALGLGSMFSAMFIFAKAELFLPLVGGVLVLTTLSIIVQRLFFKLMLRLKGREAAEKRRFFYRAPYHHHLQTLWTYSEQPPEITSVWVELQKKIGIRPPGTEDQLMRKENVDSRVVWRLHMISILMFVLALVVYFKVR